MSTVPTPHLHSFHSIKHHKTHVRNPIVTMVSVNFLISLILLLPLVKSDAHSFLHCMFRLTQTTLTITNDTKPATHTWRFTNHTPPLYTLTPHHASEIEAAIICCKSLGLQIRVRSGGHDYERQSSTCESPFIIIDLLNLRSVDVDVETKTAWVEAGATLGELYYAVSLKSDILGFPAGTCHSVGVGGHFSGGGVGMMVRKYGLAADHVVDGFIIDVRGEILNRRSMGEDLFWAIRGGGAASFGVIIAWKIKLVEVPPKVTVFNVDKNLSNGATSLVHKWQHIAHKLPHELMIRVVIQNIGSGKHKTVQATFNSLFLGRIEKLMPLMSRTFPELGLLEQDCIESNWVESTMFFSGLKGQPLESLLNREHTDKTFFKAKSDYVITPIPKHVFEVIWQRLLMEELVFIIMEPYGGRMDQISDSELPFPHRKGNIYNVQYLVKWTLDDVRVSEKCVKWIRELYRYMKPFVSANPRGAYLNYRDLDLGYGKMGYAEARRRWGKRYFKGNFKRLAEVKGRADPDNFFRNEQSIPPLFATF